MTYNGSASCFGTGTGCTGNLPLDKWASPICRYVNASGTLGLCQIGNAWQITGVNMTNSSDRASVCVAYLTAAGFQCAPSGGTPVAFSGGYADYSHSNTLAESLKDPAGNVAVYAIQFNNFTSRLLGQAGLAGHATLK